MKRPVFLHQPGLRSTENRQEHKSLSVQVPDQANQTRLVGADGEQRCDRIYPDDRDPKGARFVESVFIDPVPNLDVVRTDIVYSLHLFCPVNIHQLHPYFAPERSGSRPHKDVVCAEKRCSFSSGRCLQYSELPCRLDRVSAVIHVELAVDGLDVETYRVYRDE
jgi:hypothetical protein